MANPKKEAEYKIPPEYLPINGQRYARDLE
jgi:hypothetical protein